MSGEIDKAFVTLGVRDRDLVRGLQTAERSFGRSVGVMERMRPAITVNVNTFNINLRAAESQWERTMRRMEARKLKVGVDSSGMGRALAGVGVKSARVGAGVGLAGSMVAKEAVEVAIEVERGMAGVAKAADLSAAETAQLKRELFALGQEIKGVSFDDLVKAVTIAAKMGVAKKDLIEYARGMARVSVAMDDVPMERIAEDLGKANAIFKLGVKGLEQMGSAFDKLQDSGTSSASEIMDVVKRLSGDALAAKLTPQETAALAAALLDTGTEAERASSSIGMLLQEMFKIDNAGAMAEELGMKFDEFAARLKAKPMEVILAFLDKLKTLDKTARDATLEKVGIKAVVSGGNIGKLAEQAEQVRKYIAAANHEFETLDQLQKSVAINSETTYAQLKTLANAAQELMDNLGQKGLAPLTETLLTLKDMSDEIVDMGQETQDLADLWVEIMHTIAQIPGQMRHMGDWVGTQVAALDLWAKEKMQEQLDARGIPVNPAVRVAPGAWKDALAGGEKAREAQDEEREKKRKEREERWANRRKPKPEPEPPKPERPDLTKPGVISGIQTPLGMGIGGVLTPMLAEANARLEPAMIAKLRAEREAKRQDLARRGAAAGGLGGVGVVMPQIGDAAGMIGDTSSVVGMGLGVAIPAIREARRLAKTLPVPKPGPAIPGPALFGIMGGVGVALPGAVETAKVGVGAAMRQEQEDRLANALENLSIGFTGIEDFGRQVQESIAGKNNTPEKQLRVLEGIKAALDNIGNSRQAVALIPR